MKSFKKNGGSYRISDKQYETEGAVISSEDEVISKADAVLQMNIMSDENLHKLKSNQILLSFNHFKMKIKRYGIKKY